MSYGFIQSKNGSDASDVSEGWIPQSKIIFLSFISNNIQLRPTSHPPPNGVILVLTYYLDIYILKNNIILQLYNL